jgi:phospholipid/cholesterol/gamma-HCH transport system substrate-binding protein
MLANAAEISERIKAGEGTVGKLLSPDADLYADLKDSVASFKKACEQIKLPENMDKDVAEIMNGANKLLANLNEVSEKLKNGEGTLGKLATDSSMYDEVQGAIKDVRQVLDNYRDTTPISTFGSLIMGGL